MASMEILGSALGALSLSTGAPILYTQSFSALVLLNITLVGALSEPILASIFDFKPPAILRGLQSQATAWAATAGSQILAATPGLAGLSEIVKVLRNSQTLLTQGGTVLQDAWKSFLNLADHLVGIFTAFKPLQPIFEDKSGFIRLISSKTNVQILIAFVQKLFGTSGVLQALSDVCRVITDIFKQLEDMFESAMKKLSSRRLSGDDGRRLAPFSYKQFLDGIDFKLVVDSMGKFLTQSSGLATQLIQVNATLYPLVKSLGGRRLGASPSQKDYQTAIEQIVPAWKTVEQMGIAMCPQVLSAKAVAVALTCRVNAFVSFSGALGSLANVLTQCPVAVPQADTGKCPAAASSAGVKDMLSENSASLAWVAYVVVAVSGCGLCAGVAAYLKKRGGEPQDDVELTSNRA